MERIEKSVFATAMANVITERGWCRGTYKDNNGRVCLSGAGIEIARLEGDRDYLDGIRAAAEVFDTTPYGLISLNDYFILNQEDAVSRCLKQARYWAGV